ncbi:AaceriAAR006Wp [[Ashbya] aceris (nom. inval.)]|nr:AaceriAAR006Wp [[Ashbya] aceris (nom. inval.)]
MEEDILLALDFSTGNTEESLEAMLNEVKQATARTTAGISAAKAARREGREAKRNMKKQSRGNIKSHSASGTANQRDSDKLVKGVESSNLEDVVANTCAVTREPTQGAEAPEEGKMAATGKELPKGTSKVQVGAVEDSTTSSPNLLGSAAVDASTDKAESANDSLHRPGKSTKIDASATTSGVSKDTVPVQENKPVASEKSLEAATPTEPTHQPEAAKKSDDKAEAEFGNGETSGLAKANRSGSNLPSEGVDTRVSVGTPSVHNRDTVSDLHMTGSGPKHAPALGTDPPVQPLHSKGGSASTGTIEGGQITESSEGSTLEILPVAGAAAPAQETPGSSHVTIEGAIKEKPSSGHVSVVNDVLVGVESPQKIDVCSDSEPRSAKADAIAEATDKRNTTTKTATECSVRCESVQNTEVSKLVPPTTQEPAVELSDRSVATDSHVCPTRRNTESTTVEPSMKAIEKVPTVKSKAFLEKVVKGETIVPEVARADSSDVRGAGKDAIQATAKPNRDNENSKTEGNIAGPALGTPPHPVGHGSESSSSKSTHAADTQAAVLAADGALERKPSTPMSPQAPGATLVNSIADGSVSLVEKTNAVTTAAEDGARDDVFLPKGKKSDVVPKSGFSSTPSAELDLDVPGQTVTRSDLSQFTCSGPTTEELSSPKLTEPASAVSDNPPKFQQKGTADADETGKVLLTDQVPAVKGPDVLVGQKSSKNSPAKEPGMSHARTSSPTAEAGSKISPLSPLPNSPKLSAAHPNSAEPTAAPASARHDITKEIDDFMLELGLTDDSATKLLATLDAEASSELKNKPVYLLTSLAGGGFHMPSRTNRLATILTANHIDFQYRDCGSDDAARSQWKRQGRGRSLPAIMVGDSVVGNWHEFDEANEEWKVRQLCGL